MEFQDKNLGAKGAHCSKKDFHFDTYKLYFLYSLIYSIYFTYFYINELLYFLLCEAMMYTMNYPVNGRVFGKENHLKILNVCRINIHLKYSCFFFQYPNENLS